LKHKADRRASALAKEKTRASDQRKKALKAAKKGNKKLVGKAKLAMARKAKQLAKRL